MNSETNNAMNTPTASRKITSVASVIALAKAGRTVWRRMNWNHWRIMPAKFLANWPAHYLDRSVKFGDLRASGN